MKVIRADLKYEWGNFEGYLHAMGCIGVKLKKNVRGFSWATWYKEFIQVERGMFHSYTKSKKNNECKERERNYTIDKKYTSVHYYVVCLTYAPWQRITMQCRITKYFMNYKILILNLFL